jgi:hypothetical protein
MKTMAYSMAKFAALKFTEGELLSVTARFVNEKLSEDGKNRLKSPVLLLERGCGIHMRIQTISAESVLNHDNKGKTEAVCENPLLEYRGESDNDFLASGYPICLSDGWIDVMNPQPLSLLAARPWRN